MWEGEWGGGGLRLYRGCGGAVVCEGFAGRVAGKLALREGGGDFGGVVCLGFRYYRRFGFLS